MSAPTFDREQYGGFWRRFAAGWVDMLLFSPVIIIYVSLYPDFPDLCEYSFLAFFLDITYLIAVCAYHILFYVSSWQATPGYRALGMYITDASGKKIDGWQALGRTWAELLSLFMLGLGYLMIAFTAKRQGLHDFVAKTLVHRGIKN